jgi:hypothetical protein
MQKRGSCPASSLYPPVLVSSSRASLLIPYHIIAGISQLQHSDHLTCRKLDIPKMEEAQRKMEEAQQGKWLYRLSLAIEADVLWIACLVYLEGKGVDLDALARYEAERQEQKAITAPAYLAYYRAKFGALKEASDARIAKKEAAKASLIICKACKAIAECKATHAVVEGDIDEVITKTNPTAVAHKRSRRRGGKERANVRKPNRKRVAEGDVNKPAAKRDAAALGVRWSSRLREKKDYVE